MRKTELLMLIGVNYDANLYQQVISADTNCKPTTHS
jgi:hypothetical protein